MIGVSLEGSNPSRYSRESVRLRCVASTAASWNKLGAVGSLGRRTHPRLVNEALGRHIDRTSFAASRGVDVQRSLSPCRFSRQRNLVIERLSMVGEYVFGPKHSFEAEQTAEEIGLTANEC